MKYYFYRGLYFLICPLPFLTWYPLLALYVWLLQGYSLGFEGFSIGRLFICLAAAWLLDFLTGAILLFVSAWVIRGMEDNAPSGKGE